MLGLTEQIEKHKKWLQEESPTKGDFRKIKERCEHLQDKCKTCNHQHNRG
ncbi:MAG: hypothetical protein GY920_07250 [Aliivibrio sp.]|nr:hypothetical protein [Aliivibrio sp.]